MRARLAMRGVPGDLVGGGAWGGRGGWTQLQETDLRLTVQMTLALDPLPQQAISRSTHKERDPKATRARPRPLLELP